MPRFVVDAISDKGEWREDNEDRFLARTGRINGKKSGIFAVADGVGGLPKGELAAEIAIQSLEKWWMSVKGKEVRDIELGVTDAIASADRRLKEYGVNNDLKFATTLTVLLISGSEGYVFHIGDTKIFKIDSGGRKAIQLTSDHTRQKEPGGRYYLTQCLGSVRKSFSLVKDHFTVNSGEHYFVGSDGAFNTKVKYDLPKIIERPNVCRSILHYTRESGETDNITVIYVKIGG